METNRIVLVVAAVVGISAAAWYFLRSPAPAPAPAPPPGARDWTARAKALERDLLRRWTTGEAVAAARVPLSPRVSARRPGRVGSRR